ncbi:MAG: tetratricopeptide repeat protein, partial [Acidobacteriia bacterium]|nr:tetratricopeptide repeat protein [Terriglobia bacterium]
MRARGAALAVWAALPLGAAQPAPSFDTLAREANQARDARQFDRAASLYRQALQLNPGWVDGLWSYGSMTYDRDRYAECAPAFRKLAALKPDSAPAWTMAGLCEYKLRSFGAALESLGRAAELKFQEPPELARPARLHLALVLIKTGSFEKALATLTELTRAYGKTPEIAVAAGIAGLRMPWLPSEVPEERRGVTLKLGEAMAAAMEMDNASAVAQFEAVVGEFPSEPNVHFRFGALLMTQDEARGVDQIKQALALEPAHVPALVSLAVIYAGRGEKVIERRPADDEPFSGLAFKIMA